MISEYTPIPFAKWTHSSMLKIHEQMWSNYLEQFLSSDEYPNIINYEIDKMLEWFQLIERLCINKGLTIKK